MSVQCWSAHARMEEHVQTTLVAIPAAALVAGMDLIVPLTEMTAFHLTVIQNVRMVAPVLIKWEHLPATVQQIIWVSQYNNCFSSEPQRFHLYIYSSPDK